MSISNIHFTNTMLRIMRNAENEARHSKNKVLHPGHLLIACLGEKTGVLGEISLKSKLDKNSLRDSINKEPFPIQATTNSNFFNIAVTEEAVKVINTSINYMNRYNQIFVNEGHLLKSLVTTEMREPILSDEDKKIILTLGTISRDMITYLDNYIFPTIHTPNIHRVNTEDQNILVDFVENHFSKEWGQTIRDAFLLNYPSIFIAFDEYENIIGFAAFDVYQNKKCYFGPMGVAKSNRIKGVGYALLHHCLRDMKKIGYEYAIIGGAGPIEFYEKACNAVVIPLEV